MARTGIDREIARSSINSATTQYDANGDGKVGRCVVGGVWGGTVVIGCE